MKLRNPWSAALSAPGGVWAAAHLDQITRTSAWSPATTSSFSPLIMSPRCSERSIVRSCFIVIAGSSRHLPRGPPPSWARSRRGELPASLLDQQDDRHQSWRKAGHRRPFGLRPRARLSEDEEFDLARRRQQNCCSRLSRVGSTGGTLWISIRGLFAIRMTEA